MIYLNIIFTMIDLKRKKETKLVRSDSHQQRNYETTIYRMKFYFNCFSVCSSVCAENFVAVIDISIKIGTVYCSRTAMSVNSLAWERKRATKGVCVRNFAKYDRFWLDSVDSHSARAPKRKTSKASENLLKILKLSNHLEMPTNFYSS